MLSFIEELKRRNVFRVAIAYGVATWLLLQITDVLVPILNLSDSAARLVFLLLVIGFIPALIFAWAFEMTPDGIKKESEIDRDESIAPNTGKKLDRIIIAGLVLVIAGMVVERFFFAEQDDPTETATELNVASAPIPASGEEASSTGSGQQSVAVLPFTSMSSGEDDGYFADGLTEEILNSLAALPELLVTARTSSFHFKDQNLPIQEIATTLGVDHVVEGSVRRSGEQVRITAQLIRAGDGFHLWSNTYDRTLEDVFAVQEDIAARIAETLDVVLNDDNKKSMRNAGIGDVEAFIAYQKGMEAFASAHGTENPYDGLEEANIWLDHALSVTPEIANALYLRTDLFGHLIYDNGVGRIEPSVSELEKAHQEILSSLELAIRASDHKAQRAMFDAERTLFSDNWTSLPDKITAAFQGNDCTPTNWVTSVASVFGWSEEVVIHGRNLMRCDPLNSLFIWTLAQEEIWAMNPEGALEIAERYLEDVAYQPWVDDARYLALQATGKYRDDPSVFDPNPEGSTYAVPRRLFIHALEGEIETAREILDSWQSENSVEDMSMLIIEAVLGDKDAANTIAAEMDARYAGPFILVEAVKNCYCGAPFDINVTPNFKARIEEAGFAWPPASPLKFPAKDW
jgi:TolB-like protein